MAESVITDAMRAAIGVEGSPRVAEVTTTGIRMFARAVGYTDPIFYDEAAAKQRGFRGLVAPPGYLGTAIFNPNVQDPDAAGPRYEIPYKRILNGGTTYEYFETVVAGDIITSRSRLTEFRERDGSIGHMLITYRESDFTRQDGKLVARMRSNGISY